MLKLILLFLLLINDLFMLNYNSYYIWWLNVDFMIFCRFEGFHV